MQRTPEKKEQFYEKLGSGITATKDDYMIVLADLNARVGKDWKAWPSVIRKHNAGNMNPNDLILRELCTRLQLTVMGTMFQLKNCQKRHDSLCHHKISISLAMYLQTKLQGSGLQ